MFAKSPFLATRSAPTMTRLTLPARNSAPSMPSVTIVYGTPSRLSSQAVSRAPWRSGRVSFTQTWIPWPRACARWMTPRALPMPAVARAPALQWVSSCSPARTRSAPRSPIRSQAATSSSLIASASRTRSAALPPASTTAPRRSIAQARFTAVGRARRSRSMAARTADRSAPRSAKAATLSDAATPISGAPRTDSRWMWPTIASGSVPSSQTSASGRRVWSRISKRRSPARSATPSMSFTEASVRCGPGVPGAPPAPAEAAGWPLPAPRRP